MSMPKSLMIITLKSYFSHNTTSRKKRKNCQKRQADLAQLGRPSWAVNDSGVSRHNPSSWVGMALATRSLQCWTSRILWLTSLNSTWSIGTCFKSSGITNRSCWIRNESSKLRWWSTHVRMHSARRSSSVAWTCSSISRCSLRSLYY